jgi:hypothetical protein
VAVRSKRDLFPLYLLAVFAFSPALMDQYLAVPMLAAAILCADWASSALTGSATLALIGSPANVCRLPFNLFYYTAEVGTQICAAAMLFVEMRHADAAWSTSLPRRPAVQKAVMLAIGSLLLVWVIWLVKLIILPL